MKTNRLKEAMEDFAKQNKYLFRERVKQIGIQGEIRQRKIEQTRRQKGHERSVQNRERNNSEYVRNFWEERRYNKIHDSRLCFIALLKGQLSTMS